MIRVLAVELRRFAWRRSFRVFGLLALAGIAVATVIVFFQSQPSDQSVVVVNDQAVADCIRSFEGDQATVPAGYQSVEDFCTQTIASESFDTQFRITSLEDIFQGTSVPLIILGLALGASFIGAEWHTGTITTLLTWEPRRIRVMAAKVLAAFVGVVVSAVALQFILGLALWPTAALRGTTAGADTSWFLDTLAVVGRGALIAGLAAAIGFAIASVARNTTTALIIGFVYFAVAEGILRGLRPHWQPWLIGDNAAAFVTGDPEQVFSFGRGHGVVASLLVVASYAAGLFLVAIAWFKARDVT